MRVGGDGSGAENEEDGDDRPGSPPWTVVMSKRRTTPHIAPGVPSASVRPFSSAHRMQRDPRSRHPRRGGTAPQRRRGGSDRDLPLSAKPPAFSSASRPASAGASPTSAVPPAHIRLAPASRHSEPAEAELPPQPSRARSVTTLEMATAAAAAPRRQGDAEQWPELGVEVSVANGGERARQRQTSSWATVVSGRGGPPQTPRPCPPLAAAGREEARARPGDLAGRQPRRLTSTHGTLATAAPGPTVNGAHARPGSARTPPLCSHEGSLAGGETGGAGARRAAAGGKGEHGDALRCAENSPADGAEEEAARPRASGTEQMQLGASRLRPTRGSHPVSPALEAKKWPRSPQLQSVSALGGSRGDAKTSGAAAAVDAATRRREKDFSGEAKRARGEGTVVKEKEGDSQPFEGERKRLVEDVAMAANGLERLGAAEAQERKSLMEAAASPTDAGLPQASGSFPSLASSSLASAPCASSPSLKASALHPGSCVRQIADSARRGDATESPQRTKPASGAATLRAKVDAATKGGASTAGERGASVCSTPPGVRTPQYLSTQRRSATPRTERSTEQERLSPCRGPGEVSSKTATEQQLSGSPRRAGEARNNEGRGRRQAEPKGPADERGITKPEDEQEATARRVAAKEVVASASEAKTEKKGHDGGSGGKAKLGEDVSAENDFGRRGSNGGRPTVVCRCDPGDSGTQEQQEDEVRAMDAMYTPVKVLQCGFLSLAFLSELHDPFLHFVPASPHAPRAPSSYRATEHRGEECSAEGSAEVSKDKKEEVAQELPADFWRRARSAAAQGGGASRLLVAHCRGQTEGKTSGAVAKAEKAIFSLRRCAWVVVLSPTAGCFFSAVSAGSEEEDDGEEDGLDEARKRGAESRTDSDTGEKKRETPWLAKGRADMPSSSLSPRRSTTRSLPTSDGAAQSSGASTPRADASLGKGKNAVAAAQRQWLDPVSQSSVSTRAEFPSTDGAASSLSFFASSSAHAASNAPLPAASADQETGKGAADAEAAPPQCQLCAGACAVECVRYLFRVLGESQQAFFFAVVDVLLPRNYPAVPPYVAVGLSHAVPRKEVEKLLAQLQKEYEASKGEVVLYRLCLQLQSFTAELSSTSLFSNLWEEMHFMERQRRHLLLREQHKRHQSLKARQSLLLHHPFGAFSGLAADPLGRGFPLSSSLSGGRHDLGRGSLSSSLAAFGGDGDDLVDAGGPEKRGGPGRLGAALRGASGSGEDLGGGAERGVREPRPGAFGTGRDDELRGRVTGGPPEKEARQSRFGAGRAAFDRFGERRGENAFTFQAAVKARMRQVLDDGRQELFDKVPSPLYTRTISWADGEEDGAYQWEDEEEDEDLSSFEEDAVDIQSCFYTSSPSRSRRLSSRRWLPQLRRPRPSGAPPASLAAEPAEPELGRAASAGAVRGEKELRGDVGSRPATAIPALRVSELSATNERDDAHEEADSRDHSFASASGGGRDLRPGARLAPPGSCGGTEAREAGADNSCVYASAWVSSAPEARGDTDLSSHSLESTDRGDSAGVGGAPGERAGGAARESRRAGGRGGSLRALLLNSQRTTRYERDFLQVKILATRERCRVALVYHIIDKHKYIVKQVFVPCFSSSSGAFLSLSRAANPQTSQVAEGSRLRKQPKGLELVDRSLQQVTLLCALQHPYIMRYHQAWTQYHTSSSLPPLVRVSGGDSSGASRARTGSTEGCPRADASGGGDEPFIGVYIQMEFCERSLEDELEKRTVLHWDSQQIWTLFRQTLEALVYIHRNRVCHLSLKPSNVFLEPDAYGYNVKLGDFGVTSLIGVAHNTDTLFSRLYAAPEVLAAMEKSGRGAPFAIRDADKADMYSLGVLFAEMWARHEMFGRACSRAEFLTALVKDRDLKQLKVPSPAAKIIKLLLSPNPADRPSSMSLLQSSLLPPAVEEELFKAFLLRLRTQLHRRASVAVVPRAPSPCVSAGKKKTEAGSRKKAPDRSPRSSAAHAQGGSSRSAAVGLATEVLKIFFRRQFDAASAALLLNDFLRRSSTAPEHDARVLVQQTLAEYFARCGGDQVQVPLLVPLTKSLADCEEAMKQTPTHASSRHSESLSLLDERNVLLTLPRFFSSALAVCGALGAFPCSLHSASVAASPDAALQQLLLQTPFAASSASRGSLAAAPLSPCPFCGTPSPSRAAAPAPGPAPWAGASLSASFAHATLLAAPSPLGSADGRSGEDSERGGRERPEDLELALQGKEYRRFAIGHCYTAPAVSFLASYGHPVPSVSACFQILFPLSPPAASASGSSLGSPSASPDSLRYLKSSSSSSVAAPEEASRSLTSATVSSALVLAPEAQRTALLEAEALSVCSGALRKTECALALNLGWRVSWTLGKLLSAVLRELFFVPLSDLPSAMAVMRHVCPLETGEIPDAALQSAIERIIEHHSVLPFAHRAWFAEKLKRVVDSAGGSVSLVVERLFAVFRDVTSRMRGDRVLSRLFRLLAHRPLAPRSLLLQLLSSSAAVASCSRERSRRRLARDDAAESGGASCAAEETGDEDGSQTDEEQLPVTFLSGELGKVLVRALYIERCLQRAGEDTSRFFFCVFFPGVFAPYDPARLIFQASVGASPLEAAPAPGLPVGDGGLVFVCAAFPRFFVERLGGASEATRRRRGAHLRRGARLPPLGVHTLSFELAVERVFSFASVIRYLRSNPSLCELSSHAPLPAFSLHLGAAAEVDAGAWRLAAGLVKAGAAADEARREEEKQEDTTLPEVVVTVQSGKQLPLGFSLVAKLLRRGVRAELRVTPVVETSYFQRLLRRSRRILYQAQIQHHRSSASHPSVAAAASHSTAGAHDPLAAAGARYGLAASASPHHDTGGREHLPPFSSSSASLLAPPASSLGPSEPGGLHSAFTGLGKEDAHFASLLANAGGSSASSASSASLHVAPAASSSMSPFFATSAFAATPCVATQAAYVIEELHAEDARGGDRVCASSLLFGERKKRKVFDENAAVQLLCTALVEGYNGTGEKGLSGKKAKQKGNAAAAAGERGGADAEPGGRAQRSARDRRWEKDGEKAERKR
ncbi:hypothetical protein BESB_044240 [Besnoitia besnoiti]|uniref:Protein kinase domain-containing protein n=1 Tax=Besnoitia besnoiti TaxID=94643 RepID=A0A2A9MLA9_BESBE|nr:hypothetical protein BESB_044240 [Besnoitia besnoiti]PFH36232.1 hypothetical protein BESB_044240 [Besnoitia besnoiti]